MTCVVNWSDVCLVCLQKGENRCIFQKDDESGLSVADKIMKCSELSIIEGADQPDNICLQCFEDLNVAFKFRQNCEQSNCIIKAIISNDNRELEVSGLRIKIPSGLMVKKMIEASSSDNTLDEIPLIENSIKHEDNDCKTPDECENFESNDYLETTEILEEDEGEETETETEPFKAAFEEIEKLELIPELDDLKPTQKRRVKAEKPPGTERRGRGRPKKVFKRVPDPDYNPSEPGVTYQRALIQRHKQPPKAKPQKICEICGNSYKFQHALNSHMRRHRNERPFNCEFCDKAFVSAVELRRHMRVHTGQKPYECTYCERRFSDYGSRIKHERTHTGERPYVCSTCGKSFAYAHVLTVHMRTHTGEKKYICSECGRGFTKKAYLDNHMTHHTSTRTGIAHYEITEAKVTIDPEFEEKPEIDEDYILPTNFRVKPKEEKHDDVMMPSGFHSIAHESVP